MSNLPPGVTQASIDRAYGYGGFSEQWSGILDCEHDSAKDTEWERIERTPGHDGETYESAELTRLTEAPTEFTDEQVDDLAVWGNSFTATVQWTCRVCGEKHEDEVDMTPDYDED